MHHYYLVCAYVLAGVLGLAVGSFLNVVIYRLPNKMSLAKPNSHCPICKYELRWYDNIPVISYLALGGKCRSCKARISPRYAAVELVNALLWILSVALFFKDSPALALLYAAASSIFICIFFIDLEHKIIFDRFHVMLLAIAIATIFLDTRVGWLSRIIGGASGFLLFFLVAICFERISGKEGLGGGDIKLVGVAGLLLGWEGLLLALLIATVPAAVIMLIASRGKSGEEREFPFAPFLSFGFCVAMFWGPQIVGCYLSLLGL